VQFAGQTFGIEAVLPYELPSNSGRNSRRRRSMAPSVREPCRKPAIPCGGWRYRLQAGRVSGRLAGRRNTSGVGRGRGTIDRPLHGRGARALHDAAGVDKRAAGLCPARCGGRSSGCIPGRAHSFSPFTLAPTESLWMRMAAAAHHRHMPCRLRPCPDRLLPQDRRRSPPTSSLTRAAFTASFRPAAAGRALHATPLPHHMR
jgi:hypothetical protein